MDLIIKDSSVWHSDFGWKAKNFEDAKIRVGIVRTVIYDDLQENDIRYIVEVNDNSVQIPITCVEMQKYGGVFSFEEFIYQDYEPAKGPANQGPYTTKAGDVVVVAYLNGDAREGIILGALKHPSRKRVLTEGDGTAYVSNFNGMQTQVNSDGEYTLTFLGIPTNISKLAVPPNGSPVPAPTYDAKIGTSFFQFDKTGSITLSDNATSLPQSMKIDKAAGTVTTTAGKLILALDKNSETAMLTSKVLNINSETSITANTKTFKLSATTSAAIKAPKVAIGSEAVELLDQLVKLVDALGQQTFMSPVGPCAPAMSAPQWSMVAKIQAAINSIKGTLN